MAIEVTVRSVQPDSTHPNGMLSCDICHCIVSLKAMPPDVSLSLQWSILLWLERFRWFPFYLNVFFSVLGSCRFKKIKRLKIALSRRREEIIVTTGGCSA